MAECKDCIHFEVCAYASHDLPICDSFSTDVATVQHGRWIDNHCTACGMMPMGDEMWELCDFEPPRFEKFMDYCPNCGAKMDLEG